MKLTFERFLLISVVILLVYSLFFKGNPESGYLMEQNIELQSTIDLVQSNIVLLTKQIEELKKDTVKIIKNYITNVQQAGELIKADSSNANKVIRYELGDQKFPMEEYSSEPLDKRELALVGLKLLESSKNKELLGNYKNREATYEMKLIEQNRIIELQSKQIENLERLVEDTKVSWYEKPVVVIIGTLVTVGGILFAAN
jgi:hypothetical protein